MLLLLYGVYGLKYNIQLLEFAPLQQATIERVQNPPKHSPSFLLLPISSSSSNGTLIGGSTSKTLCSDGDMYALQSTTTQSVT